MEIINCEQGSEAWFRFRAGIPTASEFGTILTKGRGGADSKSRRTYMLRLAGERLTGEPMETFSSVHMERGKVMESEARDFYALLHSVDPYQVGFIKDGQKGCSPDSLIGESGMLEIKTALPHILLDLILKGEFPPDHKAQTQGQLWIAQREWVDIIVYWPSLPPFVRRAHRDEAYIADLSSAVDQFNEELEAIIEKVSSQGGDGWN